jgi:hypothetical protein
MAQLSGGGASKTVPTLTAITRGLQSAAPSNPYPGVPSAFDAKPTIGSSMMGANLGLPNFANQTVGSSMQGTPLSLPNFASRSTVVPPLAGQGPLSLPSFAAAPVAPTVTDTFGMPPASGPAPTTPPTVGDTIGGPPPTGAATGTYNTNAPAPDYMQNILTDPLYQQLQQNLAAQGIAAGQNRKQQTDQALAQFGEIPDLTSSIQGLGLDPASPMYQMLFGDIDPTTQDAAKQLTAAGLSTTAGLDRGHQADIQNLLDSMAARGTVQSGGTGVGLGQADRAYSQNQYNARGSLINYLAGVQSAFNQQQQLAQQQLQQGAADAAARQAALNPSIPGSTPAAAPNLAAGLG